MIELMIAVAIVGILAAIAIPAYNAYRTRSFNAMALSHIHFIKTSEANFWVSPQLYIGVSPGEGPAPSGILPNTTVPSGVGFVVGVFPKSGVDPNSGNPLGKDYVAFTGHRMGDRVYGLDTRETIYWRPVRTGLANASIDAQTENAAQLLPANWGKKL